jgi:hypothetical protein
MPQHGGLTLLSPTGFGGTLPEMTLNHRVSWGSPVVGAQERMHGAGWGHDSSTAAVRSPALVDSMCASEVNVDGIGVSMWPKSCSDVGGLGRRR